jgi:hypothetical protein
MRYQISRAIVLGWLWWPFAELPSSLQTTSPPIASLPEDDDVWLGHLLLRPGLWSPDRRHSGVVDGCRRARRGRPYQGGRGLSLATGPNRRAGGFLGSERLTAGCGFTKVARHTVRGVVMMAGPRR